MPFPKTLHSIAIVTSLGLLACGQPGDSAWLTSSSSTLEQSETDPLDPFDVNIPDDGGLTNVSSSLRAILEYGALKTACDRYEESPDDRELMLLCGKAMFFYESFGTEGVPASLFDTMMKVFPSMGRGYTGFGLYRDPYSWQGRPVGFASTGGSWPNDSIAWTCASCHVGKLPDGRFAVGMPNERYDYGLHNLAFNLVPAAVTPGFDAGAHHPDAAAALQTWMQDLEGRPLRRLRLTLALLPLIGLADEVEELTYEHEGQYASWKAGTLDLAIRPLPDDQVHIVSKILPLWQIPTDSERERFGVDATWLATHGVATSLPHFLEGFVNALGPDTAPDWPAERLAPMAAYMETLRAPANPAPASEPLVEAGADVFANSCLDCHSGPSGSGDRLYTFEEIGTDDALMRFSDPDLDGEPCCGFQDAPTHRIKSPRLVGMWAQSRFLHNGSVEGLDKLFCLDGPRDAAGLQSPFLDSGHDFTCAAELSQADREALIAYLKAH